jgi:hypothetical protein
LVGVDGATETLPGFAWSQALVQYDVSVLGRDVHVVARTNDVGAGVVVIERSDVLDVGPLGKCRIEDYRCREAEQAAITGATSEAKGVAGEVNDVDMSAARRRALDITTESKILPVHSSSTPIPIEYGLVRWMQTIFGPLLSMAYI